MNLFNWIRIDHDGEFKILFHGFTLFGFGLGIVISKRTVQ